MEISGIMSAEDNTRHIHKRYFFIKDVLKRDSIELIHCPIERMISDYFTRILQESLFRKMRGIIMVLFEFSYEERIELRLNVNIDSSGKYKEFVTEIHSRIKVQT